MTDATVSVVPIGEASWADVDRVFGTRGDPAGCWCQWFRLAAAEFRAVSRDERRERMRDQRQQHPSPGVLGYLDGEPVGWCAVAPRGDYPVLARSRIARAGLGADAGSDAGSGAGVRSVTCFVVRTGFRRRGVAAALLSAAVDYARANGASAVEGFPVDPVARASATAADLYHGTVSLFEAAGFSEVARPSASRAVMRRAIE